VQKALLKQIISDFVGNFFLHGKYFKKDFTQTSFADKKNYQHKILVFKFGFFSKNGTNATPQFIY
jgi:hypothetical protein